MAMQLAGDVFFGLLSFNAVSFFSLAIGTIIAGLAILNAAVAISCIGMTDTFASTIESIKSSFAEATVDISQNMETIATVSVENTTKANDGCVSWLDKLTDGIGVLSDISTIIANAITIFSALTVAQIASSAAQAAAAPISYDSGPEVCHTSPRHTGYKLTGAKVFVFCFPLSAFLQNADDLSSIRCKAKIL